MKFAFVTCVKLGLTCMEAIYHAGGKLDLVITLKDELAARKSGRVYVDDFCRDKEIPILKLRNINDDAALDAIRRMEIDWLFIIGWSQIAHVPLLNAPKRGAVGMHPTLLPVGRGRASIPWTILKGLSKTGVTLFKLDEGVDTGPIIAQVVIPVESDETATVLYEKVCQAHADLIHQVWKDIENDCVVLKHQDDAFASEWFGRNYSDGQILPEMTVEEAERLVRATTHPYPGAFWDNAGQIVKIWRGVIAGEEEILPAVGVLRIHLVNGAYDALEFEVIPH